MTISAIIQARMGSTRLPGKVMKKIGRYPMIELIVKRLKKAKSLDNIIVATSSNKENYPLINFLKRKKIKYFCGSEKDVLSRYYSAATKNKVTTIVRITADCPLIDPKVLAEQIEFFYNNKVDYCFLGLTFAEGICADLFSFESLQKAFNSANQKDEREHVTPYFHKHKELFKIANYENETDDSRFRIVVDQEEDFEVVSMIIKNLYKKGNEFFDIHQIKEYLIRHPDIYKLNAAIKRNESYDAFKL